MSIYWSVAVILSILNWKSPERNSVFSYYFLFPVSPTCVHTILWLQGHANSVADFSNQSKACAVMSEY
jgi:hypothetical protein